MTKIWKISFHRLFVGVAQPEESRLRISPVNCPHLFFRRGEKRRSFFGGGENQQRAAQFFGGQRESAKTGENRRSFFPQIAIQLQLGEGQHPWVIGTADLRNVMSSKRSI